jgi:hypothetical protein
MKANAAVAAGNRPDPTLMETVARGKLHPVRHRIADIASNTLGGFHWFDATVRERKSITPRTLVPLFTSDSKISSWRWVTRETDTASSDQQRMPPLHYIDHLTIERDLHNDLRRIVWLIGRLIISPWSTSCEEQ